MKNFCCGRLSLAIGMLIVACMTIFPQQVYAAETHLTTRVPAEAQLKIANERGAYINGTFYAAGSIVSVARLNQLFIDLNVEEGKEVDKVFLGEEDVTDKVTDGVLATEVNLNSELKVTYKPASAKVANAFTNILHTGDTMHVVIWGIILVASSFSLLLVIKKRRKND